MGRYYSGDIEGKFWFAVQSSDAADRFGVTGVQPSELYYYFSEEEDLQNVQDELKRIEELIGVENIKKLDRFFEETNGYNDSILQEAGLLEIWNNSREDYADYELGKKIEQCLIDEGECSFTAEC